MKYQPVAYDKSIHLQEDGSYVLTVREDDKSMNIPRATLQEAQATSALLPPDSSEVYVLPRSAFNPTTKEC